MLKKPVIVLLFSNIIERDVLKSHLEHENYAVEKLNPINPEWSKCHHADLIIVEFELSSQFQDQLTQIKESSRFLYLPILVTTPEDINESTWFDFCFDDVIRVPILKGELISRIKVVLKLRRQTLELMSYADAGRRLSAIKTPRGAALTILSIAEQLFTWDTAYLHFYSKKVNRIYPVVYIDTINGEKKEFTSVDTEKMLLEDFKENLREEPKLILRKKEDFADIVPNIGDSRNMPLSLMFIPIKRGENSIGFLSIQSYSENAYNNADLESLRMLAENCSDALERIFAEWELFQSEQQLGMLASQMPIFLWSTNTELTVKSFFGSNFLDIKTESIIGQNISFLFRTHLNSDTIIEMHRNTLRGMEVSEVIESGNKFFQCYMRPSMDRDGNVIGCAGVAIDITERKKSEEEFRRIASELNVIFQALPDLYFRFRSDGTILDAKASKLMDYYIPPDDFLNKKIREVLPSPLAEDILKEIDNVLAFKELSILEYSLPAKNKMQYYEARLMPLLEDQVIGIVRNISSQKKSERERELFARLAIRLAGTNSIEAIKYVVKEETFTLLDWDAYYFAVIRPDKNTLLVTSFMDTINNKKVEFPGKEWKLTAVTGIYVDLLNGKTVLINRSPQSTEPELSPFGNETKLSASLMFVPVRSGEKVIGIISVQSYTINKYNKAELKMFQQVADIVAPALERAYTEEALRESEIRYRGIVEDQTELIYITLPDGTYTFVNEAFCRYYYLTREKLIGTVFIPNISDKSHKEIEEKISGLSIFRPFASYEHSVTLPDGQIRWQQWTVRAVFEHNDIIKLQFVGRDITEQKIAEEKIKNALKEKEILLKEIHHRVKNNLQIISSLLNLQSKYIKEEKMLDVLKESQNRIKSMAIIHEKLYQAKDLSKIDFRDYINNLATKLFHSYVITSAKIQLVQNVEHLFLEIDKAIPCGLIVNELISNSLKHAFPGSAQGVITINMNSDEENKETVLEISDDGIGFPDDLDFRNTKSLGLQLVCTLTEQIGGKINIKKGNGTVFKLTF